jgi:hypothetical protein
MEDLSAFEKGRPIGAHLVTARMTKTATLRVSRATVSKVMLAYMNHGKTSSVKRNSR